MTRAPPLGVHSPSHLRPILLELGVRPCEDERLEPCAARVSPSSARIAVYTYNLGGYEEPRKKQVPCAPPQVDAFLFLDDVTRRKAPKAGNAVAPTLDMLFPSITWEHHRL